MIPVFVSNIVVEVIAQYQQIEWCNLFIGLARIINYSVAKSIALLDIWVSSKYR